MDPPCKKGDGAAPGGDFTASGGHFCRPDPSKLALKSAMESSLGSRAMVMESSFQPMESSPCFPYKNSDGLLVNFNSNLCSSPDPNAIVPSTPGNVANNLLPGPKLQLIKKSQ